MPWVCGGYDAVTYPGRLQCFHVFLKNPGFFSPSTCDVPDLIELASELLRLSNSSLFAFPFQNGRFDSNEGMIAITEMLLYDLCWKFEYPAGYTEPAG